MKILWSVLPLLVVLISENVAGQTDSTTPITAGSTELQSELGITELPTDSASTDSLLTPQAATDSLSTQQHSADSLSTQQHIDGTTDSGMQFHSATAAQIEEITEEPSDSEITEEPSDSDSFFYFYNVTPGIRCYTCEDVNSLDECNGVDLGENGTLQVCTEDRPNCMAELKMNPTGTGWMFRKGCVDIDECYDNMFDSLLAEENYHCLGEEWSGMNDSLPLLPSTWCYFCCVMEERDMCDLDVFINEITFPENNDWDPRMQWDFSIVEEAETSEHSSESETSDHSSESGTTDLPSGSGTTDIPSDSEATELPSDSDSYSFSYSYSYVAPSGMVRCYTCKDVNSHDECNGIDLGENGTLQVCEEEHPSCKIEVKMNPTGTGWMFRKGCVDFNECYDHMYDSLLAEENFHCLGEIWSGRNDTLPLLPSTWCYFCCTEAKKDMCNYDQFIRRITFPEKNEWDPRMQWDFSIEGDGDAAENLKPMLLFTLAIITAKYLVL